MSKVHKVVYNACFGGFWLSDKAAEWLKARYPEITGDAYAIGNALARHDARLVAVVEALGDDASGEFAKLRVETIDTNVYRIDEYDGNESVETSNDVNWTVIPESESYGAAGGNHE